METQFDVQSFDIKEFDRILSCGLSGGLGKRGEQVCIEAAICQVLNLPHSDDPGCVAASVREFKIRLNDSRWSSPASRANGLRDLGLAQLGSKGVVDNVQFCTRLAEKTIRILLPVMIRDLFPDKPALLEAADLCEKDGDEKSARLLEKAAYAAYAAYAADAASAAYAADAAYAAANAAYAAYAAAYAADAAYAAANAAANAAYAAYAAAYAADAYAAVDPDKYLVLEAGLALEVLRELNSPGIALLEK